MSVLVFISAGSSGDGGVNSNSYNVVMVGNSSVGKTSFMRRVQNGRFFSDLPSSIGKKERKISSYAHAPLYCPQATMGIRCLAHGHMSHSGI